MHCIRNKCLAINVKRQLSLITPAAHNQQLTTLPFISAALKTSANHRLFNEANHFHAHIIKLGFANVLSLANQLLHVYVKCNEFFYACKLFDEMWMRNVVTWNTLICGLADSTGSFMLNFDFGFRYFKRMMMESVPPDRITYSGLFRICGEVTGGFEAGRGLHCLVVKLGFCKDCFINCALIGFYGKFELVGDAKLVFEGAKMRDLVLWNAMVSCYVSNGLGEEAFQIYALMLLNRFKADLFTFASLLNCCAKLVYHELGRQIHGLVFKLCFDMDVVVGSAIIDMYVKNENTVDARKAFGGMASRNVVSWTTMILGYGRDGDGKEAIKLLKEMLREDFCPDELTLASVLSSCGNLSMASEVVQVHANAIKCVFSSSLSIANSLINAYSKCGCIASALKCFNSIGTPDLISWTSIIGAYTFHGFAEEAIKLFEKMLSCGLKPDKIAFLEVLSACSHGGLLSEGLKYFTSITDHNILLTSEHYACLIDLLGRVGLLNDANFVLNSIPLESQSHALKAFIGASEIHGNIELSQWAAKKLCFMEPNNAVNYILLSKSYASDRNWSDAAVIRELVKEKMNSRIPGISWTEIAYKVHSEA
ncbi:pentatricopeptide repeat-containing protein At2g46050, mitochondrial [Ipomoea triloba]|uniref:pentatricopeptide repeat-containing protein At2g46050, mitochondrial n=1 Tax=Ipomoea triloba TaxID=35885 RepID=UPI00125E2807|nr:pentatricopeptide repeat-containing protein At2g46050, mitochondrial [Ipomoea triloba]XP_031128729.1 pentatricopeptide repeat-containing protein At2g46050, mitochondrial [Ipomoea triloba]